MKANLSGQDQKRRMNSIVKKAMHKVSITQNPNFLLKSTIKKSFENGLFQYENGVFQWKIDRFGSQNDDERLPF